MCGCVNVYVYVRSIADVWMHAYVCVCVCLSFYLYVYVLCICMSECLYLSMSISLSVRISVANYFLHNRSDKIIFLWFIYFFRAHVNACIFSGLFKKKCLNKRESSKSFLRAAGTLTSRSLLSATHLLLQVMLQSLFLC